MFNSPVINLVILLAFTYFIASLLVSAINEAITGAMRLRSKQLQAWLENLFNKDNTSWKAYVKGEFLKSPFIQSLQKDAGKFPAYIPAKNFALAILGQCNIDRAKLDVASVLSAIDAATCVPEDMKKVVKGYIQEGTVKIEELEKDLEEFFNNAMDRLSGWYKRRVRLITFIIGLVMAIVLNIDTIKIVAEGLSDKDRLDKTADAIAQQVAAANKDGNLTVTTNGNTITASVKTASASDSTDTTSAGNYPQQAKAAAGRSRNIVLIYEKTTGYQLGYSGEGTKQAVCEEWFGKPGSNGFLIFLKKLLGVLITAFALQLGSGYWFGVLNKVVSIRAAGVKPEEKEKQAAK